MARTLEQSIAWMDDGTERCSAIIGTLEDDQWTQPCALPGWTRAHLVAHLDGNARALQNLVHWADTGVETPMYSSPEQRNDDIQSGAQLPGSVLRARFEESRDVLSRGLRDHDEQWWSREVRTGMGRVVPASTIPWLRSREVMIHAVDLDAGVTFDDLPPDFLAALIDDVVKQRSAIDGHPVLELTTGDRTWVIGTGTATAVTGSLGQLAAYLTGRGMLGPAIPAWL